MKLGDLITLQRGYDLTDTERLPGSVPVIGSAGPNGYHKEARAKAPGITLGRCGGSFGKVTFVREDFWPHNTTLFVTDFKGNDPIFVRYLLETLDFSALNSGSAQQSLNRNYIYGVQIPNFEPGTQRKIAAVLAAYDDLIEANRRRIALLERMAEEIYREWFVRLRFPGHATTKITKGLPAGWTRTRVANLTSYLKRGVAPSYDDQADGIAINQKCIRDGRIDLEYSRRQSREVSAERLIQAGDILINSTVEGTLGRVAQVLAPIPKCIVDSHVTIVRPAKGVPVRFLGLTLQAWEPHLATMGLGSTNQTELSPFTIGRVELRLPPPAITDRFEALANPIATQARLLAEQNVHLTRTRDLLLPRLISGKLPVEALPIAFPPSMAAGH